MSETSRNTKQERHLRALDEGPQKTHIMALEGQQQKSEAEDLRMQLKQANAMLRTF